MTEGKSNDTPTHNSPEGFPARLKRVVRTYGSASALAKAAGVSEGAMRKWTSGTSEPARDRLVAVARAAGVSLKWLATGNGPMGRGERDEAPLLEGFVTLRRIESGDDVQENPRWEIAFGATGLQSHFGREASDLVTVRVPDDSMVPLLPAGSELVVDRRDGAVNRDGIHALTIEGTLMVRRLQRLPGGQIEASPESTTYQSFRFQHDDPGVSVIGRAIWVGRDL